MAQKGRGRPPKYASADDLQKACDAYFKSCEGHYRLDDSGALVLDRRGCPILDGAAPVTITGLQIALGFKTRKSLLDYRGKKEFKDIIDRARLRVEQYAEERLFDRDGFSGASWVLSTAFDWKRDQAPEDNPTLTVSPVQIVTDKTK